MNAQQNFDQVKEAFRADSLVQLAVEQQSIWDTAVQEDVVDPLGAQLRSAESKAEFIAQSWDGVEVGRYLGKRPATIRSYAADLKLSSFLHQGKRRYPKWQFSHGQVIPGLKEILQVVPKGYPPRALAGFFANDRHLDLSIDGQCVSPITWLWSDRDSAEVAKIAKTLGAVL